MKTILSSTAGILFILLFCMPLFSQSSLKGVWKRAEIETERPDTTVHYETQPGLLIVGEKYYSFAFVLGEEARPLFPEDVTRSSITDEQMRSAFLNYVSNSGTYEATEDTFITKPTVALWPNFMETGSETYSYKIEDDVLYMTFKLTSNAESVTLKEKWIRLK